MHAHGATGINCPKIKNANTIKDHMHMTCIWYNKIVLKLYMQHINIEKCCYRADNIYLILFKLY